MIPALLAVLALGSDAHAWETLVDPALPHLSLQADPNASGNRPLNEHGLLLNEAMITIDAAWSARQGDGDNPEQLDLLVLPDYNATWYRDGEIPLEDADSSSMLIRDRRLPRLSMMAGLPDISFSVTDWINLNTYCPVLPDDAVRPGLCHDYGGYLGAGLNATHFGALASGMYARHHAIAVREAENARDVHALLLAGGNDTTLPDGTTWHEDAIVQAEMLALTFEGTGQHYLQDRLAVGHMFGRWGSGSYEDIRGLTDSDPLVHAQAMGLLSGVQHGSFAVFGVADGMNFPEDDIPSLMVWPQPNGFGQTDPSLAIGDDLRGALFTGDTPDGNFDFSVQRQTLLTCTAGGLRDVVSHFVDNGDGTYGAAPVTLADMGSPEVGPAVPLGFDPSQEPGCSDLWVDNWTYYRGSKIPTREQIQAKLVAKLEGRSELGELPQPGAVVRMGPVLLANRAVAFANMIRSPGGTQSSKDGITFDMDGFWIANKEFDVPAWVEPEDLSTLPAESDDGRDLRAVDGLFHRAHPERTCATVLDTLATLREAATDPERTALQRDRAAATCASMARVVWRGTDPAYEGIREERAGQVTPDTTTPFGEAYEPLCAYWSGLDDVPDMKTSDASDDAHPYWIHPGYVADSGAFGENSGSTASLEAWCRSAPVLDMDSDDVVGTLDHTDADRYVRLTGRNLGFRTTSGAVGSIRMQDTNGLFQAVEIFDNATGMLGGWGDTFEVDILVPLAIDGFPSLADPGDGPAEIKDPGATARYALDLTRAEDADADGIFLADGQSLTTQVAFDIEPSWVELAVGALPPDVAETGFWVVRPDAHQDDLTRLTLGFYRLETDGSYTFVDIPFTERDDERPVSNTTPLEWESVPDSLGIHIVFDGALTPAVFANNDISLFYAYH